MIVSSSIRRTVRSRPRSPRFSPLWPAASAGRAVPTGGAVAQLTRVSVDDAVNERIDNARSGSRATAARHGAEAALEVVGFTRFVLLDPVVDGAPADAEALRHIFDAVPGGEPQ